MKTLVVPLHLPALQTAVFIQQMLLGRVVQSLKVDSKLMTIQHTEEPFLPA